MIRFLQFLVPFPESEVKTRRTPEMLLSDSPPPGIALFDMDGTLLSWDCQLLFRHHVLRAEPVRWFAVPVFLMFLPLAGLLGTENMKRIFHCFLWKMTPERLEELSREFAEKLRASIYPELIAEIRRHQSAGHLTVLSSASPQCYVVEVGTMLGFDVSLGTVFEDEAFFPELVNHKGEAKVLRLKELLPLSYFAGGKLVNSHGYSDSTADLPMLAICQKATVVNPGERLRALAEVKGWEILRPARPWKSALEKSWRVILLLFAIGKNPAKL